MTHPSFDDLVALWAGDGDAAVEEHAFTCDTCAATYVRLGALRETLRTVIPPVISHTYRDRLVAGGTRILHTPVEPGVDADATFTPDVDLLVHVLHADLADAASVDVAIVAPTGELLDTLEAVPFDARRGEVLIACQRHYTELFPGDPSFVLAIHAPEPRTSSFRVRHHVSV